jgi:2-keto-3-deoxy-L-fuconate dehydrogenase
MRLKGKTAFVTAAGAGIGRASALAFHREGAHVWASDIDEAALRSLASEAPGIEVALVDVRDDQQVADAFAAMGPCDVLLNCAGVVQGGTVLDADPAAFAAALDINVISMVRTVRAALPAMLERRAGAIINMSSVASSIKGAPGRCAYGASKAAVIGLTKAVAADFAADGVRCNAICPGTVDTPSLRARIAGNSDPVAARAAFEARQPMRRFGRPEEIAALAVYLGSDESAFVTGQAFVIDGGWTI